MITKVQEALAMVAANFADKRLHVCRIEIAAVNDASITLQGVVLDKATLTAVTQHLLRHFPGHALDIAAVTVLRQPQPHLLVMTTTITGLHNAPGFLSEPGSQLLNGTVVEWLQEDGRWAFVRQTDGYLGWVYRPYCGDVLPPEATHLVCEPVGLLRTAPEKEAALLNRILGGTAVAIEATSDAWQQIKLADGQAGWLPATELRSFNAFPQTAEACRVQLVADAHRFIGVPYLWAGISAYGLDCSGYVQLLHKLSGMPLPRDADMQYMAGQPVMPPYQPGDLFFFGGEGDHRRISHVGMSLGGWQMIHASRSHNGVFIDDVQAVDHLRDRFAGARSFLP